MSFNGLKEVTEVHYLCADSNALVHDLKSRSRFDPGDIAELVRTGDLVLASPAATAFPDDYTIYQAATFDKSGKPLLRNNGHLGCIDSPECGDRIYGNFTYSATPTPVATMSV